MPNAYAVIAVVVLSLTAAPAVAGEDTNDFEQVVLTPERLSVDESDGYVYVEARFEEPTQIGPSGYVAELDLPIDWQGLVASPDVDDPEGATDRFGGWVVFPQGTSDGAYTLALQLYDGRTGTTATWEGDIVIDGAAPASPPPELLDLSVNSVRHPWAPRVLVTATLSPGPAYPSVTLEVNGVRYTNSSLHLAELPHSLREPPSFFVDVNLNNNTDSYLGLGARLDIRMIEVEMRVTAPRRQEVAVRYGPDDLESLGIQSAYELTAGLTGTGAADLLDDDLTTSVRVPVDTPADWAVEVSRMRFADGAAQGAVLVSAAQFADALAATALLGQAPLFLVPPDGNLPSEVSREIDRVVPEDVCVTVVGGSAAIAAVTNSPRPLCDRLAGDTRITTAIAVADARLERGPLDSDNPPHRRVFLARAFAPADNPTAAWADATTAGALVSASGSVLLLNPTGRLDPHVEAWLREHRMEYDQIVLLGGTAALSRAVQDAAAVIRGTDRYAGASRDETAVAIANSPGNLRSDRVFLVDGYSHEGWAWQLATAGLAADVRSTSLLTREDRLADATRGLLCQRWLGSPSDTVVVGPPSTISDVVQEEAVEIAANGC